MGRLFRGLLVSTTLIVAACGSQESSGPTFQLTSPTLATTSTTLPSTLEYVGLPDLTADEAAMCDFIEAIGRDIDTSDRQTVQASAQKNSILSDRTLAEPLKVRRLRDIEIANAQRFANVLVRFGDASELINKIEPGPLVDETSLEQDAADAALLFEIGSGIQDTVAEVRPLNATEQAEFSERTGREWQDLFTTAELDDLLATLNNDSTGMGREAEAREALERLDDWSWRHCSAGLTD